MIFRYNKKRTDHKPHFLNAFIALKLTKLIETACHIFYTINLLWANAPEKRIHVLSLFGNELIRVVNSSPEIQTMVFSLEKLTPKVKILIINIFSVNILLMYFKVFLFARWMIDLIQKGLNTLHILLLKSG